jgi:hypothetical protein
MGLIGSRSYTVEFDDSLTTQVGWKNPRYEGSKLSALYYNCYTEGGEDTKFLGAEQNANLSATIETSLPLLTFVTGVTTASDNPWDQQWFVNANDQSDSDPTVGGVGANTGGQGPKHVSANITYSNVNILGPMKEYPAVPTVPYDGDSTYSVLPVVQNTTNTVFIGTSIIGNKEMPLYPGPGPDFSYLRLDKALTFNTEDDTFFTIENQSDNDSTFERVLQTNLPWAASFQTRLLDYNKSHDLKQSHGVHFNRGLFGLFGKYTAYKDPANENVDVNGHYVRSVAEFETGSFDMCYYYNDMYLRGVGEQPTAPGHGLTWNDPTYYGLDTASYGEVLSYRATYFEITSRKYQGAKAQTILGSGLSQTKMSASFDVYTENPNTRWWTKQGGATSIQNVSQSSVNRHRSMKYFIDQVISGSDPGLYIITMNDAINADRTFRMGVEEDNLLGGTASNVLYQINKPLITFGSFPIGPSKYVGVPNSSKTNTGYYGDLSGGQLTNSSPNLAIPDGYAPIFTKYWAQPHKIFAIPTIPHLHANGKAYYDFVWYGTENNYYDNYYTGVYDSDHPVKPHMDNWAMYKLDVRSNIILTDLNKRLELKDGIGKKGFIVIPENLNPEIANNLDFYLAKAGLIDREKAPKLKDKSLIKNKPKPGFFKKKGWRGKKGY